MCNAIARLARQLSPSVRQSPFPKTAWNRSSRQAQIGGPLQMARELDDAILSLRASELELGLWIFKTAGNPEAVLNTDKFILENQDNWFVREVLGMMRRTFARIDVHLPFDLCNSRAGVLLCRHVSRVALAADRIYITRYARSGEYREHDTLEMNFGPLPMVNKLSRLAARFYDDEKQ